jgi:hypothetical protein
MRKNELQVDGIGELWKSQTKATNTANARKRISECVCRSGGVGLPTATATHGVRNGASTMSMPPIRQKTRGGKYGLI